MTIPFLLAANLVTVVEDGRNREARQAVLFGAMLAGQAVLVVLAPRVLRELADIAACAARRRTRAAEQGVEAFGSVRIA